MVSACFMEMRIQAAIWHDLAQQAATAAAQMHDPELRLSMLSIAASYEAMAQRAEAMDQPTTEQAVLLAQGTAARPQTGSDQSRAATGAGPTASD